MIERYTIKFGPAVSQKEMEKALDEGADDATLERVHRMKARIELIGDFNDVKKLKELLAQLSDRA